MSQVKPSIERTDRFILSCQLQSLCNTLRFAVQLDRPIGTISVVLVKKLRGDLIGMSSGKAVENFPDVDETMKAADLLALAEVMNGTLDAFLSP